MTSSIDGATDHLTRQAETIALGLEKLAAEASQLAAGEEHVDRMVMIDTHTAEAIAQTVRALSKLRLDAQAQAKRSEGMELKALRERDAARRDAANPPVPETEPIAWMVEDLVLPMRGGPIFTLRRDRAEGLFGDPSEFKVTPLYAKAPLDLKAPTVPDEGGA